MRTATPKMDWPKGQWVLFESSDEKSLNWSLALSTMGIGSRAIQDSPAHTPVMLIRTILARRRPSAVFFRYLNDYRSLVKTMARMMTEIAGLLVCRIWGIRIFWMCHNVDRETKRYHPAISEVRRSMFAKTAERIFVMDEGLVPFARSVFPAHALKVDFLCFGPPKMQTVSDITEGFLKEVLDFLDQRRCEAIAKGQPFLSFSCIGRPGDKYDHFRRARDLVREAGRLGYSVAGIVAGPFIPGKYDDDGEPFFGLDREPSILFRGEYIPLDEVDFLDSFDFIWRGYRDWSMSYTLYKAAAIRKPVLALGTGFVGMAVGLYGLGAVVQEDLSDLGEALESIARWDPAAADEFLKSHSWEQAALRMATAIRR